MMKQSKQQIYRSLKRLEKNNVVLASREFPAVFSADSFEKVLDLLSIKKEGQAEALEKLRTDLLNSWQRIIAEDSANVPSNFNERNKTEK